MTNTAENVIDIENLQMAFGDLQVLKGLHITLKKSENLVVLGKSGSGKSVLIKCIAGLLHPDKGKIQVLGKNVPGLDEKKLDELRMKIGFLFQSSALYDSMTVRENLEFPLRRNKQLRTKTINELVEEALENVDLVHSINKMPSELSGGMKKRTALARTLILKPEIMLYDEPTTGLDPVTAKEISHLILSIQKKYHTSSIIITHDMACAKITSNRIAIIRNGVKSSEGDYSTLEHSDDINVRNFFC